MTKYKNKFITRLFFIGVIFIFLAILAAVFLIYQKVNEKNEITSHVIHHADMPKEATGISLYFDRTAFLVKNTLEHINDISIVEKNEKLYKNFIDSFRARRAKFNKIVNSHDAKWHFSEERLAQDQEHQKKHNENRVIIAKLEDSYDKFIVLTDSFFKKAGADNKQEAKAFYQNKMLPALIQLEGQLENFLELQEWEMNYHTNELYKAQKAVDNFILNLILIIVISAFIWLIFFYFAFPK